MFRYMDATCSVWGCLFSVTVKEEASLKLEDGEVQWIKFIPFAKVQQLLKEGQADLDGKPGGFTPVGKHVLELYLQRRGSAAASSSS